jgi:hypothetical protein
MRVAAGGAGVAGALLYPRLACPRPLIYLPNNTLAAINKYAIALVFAMSILELPIELLQFTIDIAVQHTDLHRAIRFRETCRTLPQDSRRTSNLTYHRQVQ